MKGDSKRPDEITLRLIVVDPPADVALALQQGRSALVGPSLVLATSVSFEFRLRVVHDTGDRVRLLGPVARGPSTGRFVYLNAGTLAGQASSCWTRRAKVPLASITASLVDQAISTKGTIEARLSGRARDGGPACASVPLLEGGWSVVAGGKD